MVNGNKKASVASMECWQCLGTGKAPCYHLCLSICKICDGSGEASVCTLCGLNIGTLLDKNKNKICRSCNGAISQEIKGRIIL